MLIVLLVIGLLNIIAQVFTWWMIGKYYNLVRTDFWAFQDMVEAKIKGFLEVFRKVNRFKG
jgi:hypothetical protein